MAKQILFATLARIAALCLGFIANILLARYLGPQRRGEYAVILTIPSITSGIATMGLDAANLYYGGQSPAAFAFAARYSLVHSIVAGAFISSIYYLVSLVVPALRFGLTTTIVLSSLAVGILSLPLSLLGLLEASRQRLFIYNTALTGSSVIYVCGLLLLVYTNHFQLTASFWVFAISQAGIVVWLLWTTAPWRNERGNRPSLYEYYHYGLRSYLLTLIQFLLLRLDTPVLRVLSTAHEVGIYAVAYSLAEAVFVVTLALNTVLLPSLVKQPRDERSIAALAILTTGGAFTLAAVLGVATPLLLPLLYSRSFSASVRVLWILLPGSVVFSGGRVLQTYFMSKDVFRGSIFISVVALCVMLSGDVLLMPVLGAEGAAIANTAAYVTYAAGFFVLMIRSGASFRDAVPYSIALLRRRVASLIRP